MVQVPHPLSTFWGRNQCQFYERRDGATRSDRALRWDFLSRSTLREEFEQLYRGCARRSDDTNGASLGASRYRYCTYEHKFFLLLGLDSRGLHLKPYVSSLVH